MALPLPQGIVPAEVAFLCEMEHITVVPRQRLEPICLLGGDTPALRPPHRTVLPLWLALLLKRQRRCSIVAPPWLHPASLRELVLLETREGGGADEFDGTESGGGGGTNPDSGSINIQLSPPPPVPARAYAGSSTAPGTAHRPFRETRTSTDDTLWGPPVALSPPFLPSCTAEAPAGFLPYHWFEVAELLLTHAPDDLPAPPGDIRALLRDLSEARGAKVRLLGTSQGVSSSAATNLRGIGAMELAEARGLVTAVHDGVRRLGAAAEASRREEEEVDLARGGGRGAADYEDDDSDDDMGI